MRKLIEAYPFVNPLIPFKDLKPEQITFYMHLSNKTGHNDGGNDLLDSKKTCGSACHGCYFKNLAPYEIPAETAKEIARDLRQQGYDLGIVTADGFSDASLYSIGEAGSAFRLSKISTKNGNAWTSGFLLSKDGWEERLHRGWDIGYGAITISLYGSVHKFPIKGVPQPKTVQQAIRNVRVWNTKNPEKVFTIATTQRIFPNTLKYEALRKTADWCIENGVNVLRWNAQANFLNIEEHINLELCAKDIYEFYGNLSLLQKNYETSPIRFGISEDIGAHGIEQIMPWLSEEWREFEVGSNYWCRAGYRLFSINRIHEEIVVTGCVDKWAPVMGIIKKFPDNWKILWDYDSIERLRTAILKKEVYGCHGGVGYNHGRDRGFSVDIKSQEGIYGKQPDENEEKITSILYHRTLTD